MQINETKSNTCNWLSAYKKKLQNYLNGLTRRIQFSISKEASSSHLPRFFFCTKFLNYYYCHCYCHMYFHLILLSFQLHFSPHIHSHLYSSLFLYFTSLSLSFACLFVIFFLHTSALNSFVNWLCTCVTNFFFLSYCFAFLLNAHVTLTLASFPYLFPFLCSSFSNIF